MRPTFYRVATRDVLLFSLPVILGIGIALWYVLNFAQPAPQKRIVITTGGETGAYFKFARRYAEILARSKIAVEVRTSAGAVQNYARLKDQKQSFDVAFVQGGVVPAKQKEEDDLVSIGRLFYEPLWIFHGPGESLDRLIQLKGKRLAVGPEGSGTRALVINVLAPSGVDAKSAALSPLTGMEAIAALEKGEVDAVFLSAAPEAPAVQAGLRNRKLRLMSLAQADAYTRVLPYLTKLTLPQGVIDFVDNIPASDVNLVATSAALVVRDELHPALVYLLAQAAAEVHGTAGFFNAAGEFPKPVDPEFQLSDNAVRFYKNGAPVLQRYFPFWLANFIERMIVLLVPILTIAIPLFKLIPWLYRWRIRERILFWYAQVKKVESNLDDRPTPGKITQLKDELDKIEDEVNNSPVPLGFSEQFYNLRGHIELVRQRLGARPTAAPA